MPVKALDAAGRSMEVRQLALEFSFDDGANWQPAEVASGAALSRGGGYVSIRVTATSATGAETAQSVNHAYRYQ
jgi:hypothetical protein